MSAWPATLVEALERARGALTLIEGRSERRLPWRALVESSAEVAAGLGARGLGPGASALLVLPTGEPFLAALFGCARARVAPCQLAPPEGFGAAAAFARRLAEVVALVAPGVVLASGAGAERVRALLGPGGPPVLDPLELRRPASSAARGPDPGPEDVAFVQLTSGTTHRPKGVVVPHAALATNTRQIAEVSAMRAGDVVVSWLPMFHDMGLVGMLSGLFAGLDCALLPPMSFIRRPAAWLEAIARHRGTHSPAPTFAYRYLVERLGEARGLDLSSWRVAFVGAEPIPPGVLAAFSARCAPLGLAETALVPCYGMAEATLALTMVPSGRRYRTLRVDRRALREEGRARPGDGEPGERETLELVPSGPPLPGTRVLVRDEAGAALPAGCLGEVWVEGPQLARGYLGQPPFAGALATGDLGFLDEGELVVTGRRKDLIILRGQNHHPEEVEWVAAQVPGVRAGRAVALGVEDPSLGTERLALVAEHDRRAVPSAEELALSLRRRVHEETGLTLDLVQLVDPGSIQVTTSGKLRRAAARELLAGGAPGPA